MDKTKTKKIVKINFEFCKACGFCSYFCPDKALEFDEGFNSQSVHPVKWKGECCLCGQCYLVCPDGAIEIVKED